MNKIVIVGHPLSGYQEVETLLNACGMATAQPSRREGYMPGQISKTLCKVHSAAPLSQLETDDQIQQIEAGPVWHGMALDLMLGNLEQPFWGWADPQSIYLLNYWRDLDPSITFILVYDRPHSVLTQACDQDAAGLSPETLSQRTRNWAAYNAALLHFFHRNPQRCLLVHSQQVRESASSYLQQVRSRINAPWSERMEQLSAPGTPAAEDAPVAQDESDDSINVNPSDTWYETPSQANTKPSTTQAIAMVSSAPATDQTQRPAPPHNALALFVADALLRQHPTSLQLYEELQAVANLPFADGADSIVNDDTALQAWLNMTAHQLRLREQTRMADTQMGEITELNQRLSHTDALAQQKQQLVERLSQAQAQAEQLAQERQRVIDEQTRLHQSQTAASQQRLAQLQSQQQALQHAQQTAQQENELLMNQLHQVQETLERQLLQSQQQAQQAAQEQAYLAAAQAQASQRAIELGQQAALLQKHLEEKDQQAQSHAAQARMIQAEKQASEQENELLLTQLHHVQEELERQYLANQAQTQQLQALLQTDKLAAERKQQIELLRLQLAAQTQEANKKITQLRQQFAKNQQETQAQAGQLQAQLLAAQSQVAAPVVEPALEQENELLLAQLQQVREELELYHQENLRIKRVPTLQVVATPAHAPARKEPISKPVYYGAGERVRQQMSYRLGATIIRQSGSLLGWIGMPMALIRETRQYQREKPQRAALNLPPISQYRDSHEAERYRKHLSFRLGQTFLTNLRSPIGWIRMPFALRREVKRFRNETLGH